MNSTLKCWVIANFGVVIWIIVVVIGLIFTPKELFSAADFWDKCLICWFILGGISCAPCKTVSSSVSRFLVIFGSSAILVCYSSGLIDGVPAEELAAVESFAWLFWICFVAIQVIAFLLARYAWIHFDEVVSRRMLYRNSAVDLFDIQWKYTIVIFMDAVSALTFLAAIVGGISWLRFV